MTPRVAPAEGRCLMKVEIITPSADPDRGGFGSRVHGIVSMFSQFADVRVVVTDRLNGNRVPGVEYVEMPLSNSLRTRMGRMRGYYRRDFPPRKSAPSPDLVVVESLDLIGLHQYGPRVPMVLDEHNVYWNLLDYEMENAPFFQGWLGRRRAIRRVMMPRLLERAKAYEIEAIRRAARTLVTSDADRKAVVAACPEAEPRVRVLPNCADLRRVPALPDPANSRTVVFIGDFNYVPNREAAEFVYRSLAPALPNVRLLLVGPNQPSWPSVRNVVATGYVPDLLAVLRDAAICIAPLAHGSGTRIKILTYLAASRAVVATTKACEGLPVRDGQHLLIRDDPIEFRNAIYNLIEDPESRQRLGTAGRALVESAFDWPVHVPALREMAREICAESMA